MVGRRRLSLFKDCFCPTRFSTHQYCGNVRVKFGLFEQDNTS